MLETLLFYVFSIIEIFAMYVFVFTIFRFNFKDYVKEVVVSSILITTLSYYLRIYEDVGGIVNIIIFLSVCLIYWVGFRISPLYSLLLGSVYFIYGFVQVLVLLIYSLLGIMDIQMATSAQYYGYLLQISTAILFIIISIVLWKYRLWFTFVPINFTGHKIKIKDIIFILLITMFAILIGSVVSIGNIYLLLIHLSLVVAYIIFVYIRKEVTH